MITISSIWFGLYVKDNTPIIIILILLLTIKKSIDSDIILKIDIDWLNLTVEKSAIGVAQCKGVSYHFCHLCTIVATVHGDKLSKRTDIVPCIIVIWGPC